MTYISLVFCGQELLIFLVVIVEEQQRPDKSDNTKNNLDDQDVDDQEVGLAFDVGDLVM